VLYFLTTAPDVVIISNMNAELMLSEYHIISEDAFVEIVIWRLTTPIAGCRHLFKYRLAFIVNEQCVFRYDNETGKGDHKHIGKNELPYIFTTPQALLDNFWKDVDNWRY
jgi:hypothetical protein